MKNNVQHSGIRSCVNCGSNDSQLMFTFTKKWLTEVRKVPQEWFDNNNLDENFSSSIVKCRNCGCGYIKDVMKSRDRLSNWSTEELGEKVSYYQSQFSRKDINHLQYNQSLINNLLELVLRKKKTNSELSLLDYGCSWSTNSAIARVMGFSTVVAYDPLHPENISKITPSNMVVDFKFVPNFDDLKKNAPYDAIICQSADEHFYDLQGELKNINDLLSDDGIAYFSHPIMDLDADIKFLRNEANIKDKKILSRLSATFHVYHLNYVMPKMFKKMLNQAGLKEVGTCLMRQRYLGANSLSSKKIIPFLKSYIKYFLSLMRSNYRKTEFFTEKVNKK